VIMAASIIPHPTRNRPLTVDIWVPRVFRRAKSS
jgi:hypothetical protein